MSNKNTLFYKQNQAYLLDFSAEDISSDSSIFSIIKQMIRKTKHKKAHKWQIDNIRLFLLKAGGTITKTVKRIYIKLSKAFAYKDLLYELAFQ